MPRPTKVSDSPKAREQKQLLWQQTGSMDNSELASWDPKQVDVVQAILEVLSTGVSIYIRPGSGGRALGIAIWEGDVRHPAKWLYTAEELDEWASDTLDRAAEIKGRKGEQ